MNDDQVTVPRPRGFAAMDRDKVREIASRGGKAAHAAGTAHQFTEEEARAAGKKGGSAHHKWRGKQKVSQ
jgi:general stress protein YciG